jgi:hypothetical protein
MATDSISSRVEARGACVEVSGPWLLTVEFSTFADWLAALYNDLNGTAELAGMEPASHVRIGGGSLGHLTAIIEITPDHMTQSHRAVLTLAAATGLTAYDASYLWLARRLGAKRVTLDRQLAAAAQPGS